MLRSLLLSLFIFYVAYLLKSYVDSFAPIVGKEEMVNTLEGVTIKSYGRGGLEWTIRGKSMEVVGKEVKLSQVELTSKEATIRAQEVLIDRSTGMGSLVGDVVLLSADTQVRSPRVNMNLREGEFSGEEGVDIQDGRNRIEGVEFQLTLKPMRIIINKVKVRME